MNNERTYVVMLMINKIIPYFHSNPMHKFKIDRSKNMPKIRAIITDTNSNQKSKHIEKPCLIQG